MAVALYRRYRPDTFDQVVGQEHVTELLEAALDQGRVSHAYLFSGPRGCGKTTSARIFARCLNCAEGPTATPCGVCESCVELASEGPGSLDVVEIDAASHGGVDDARSLRERASFAPARDRYKIFILDEAHMVTPGGFNALLKIVEEPPEHVKFIFATTAPEKVISTIRSRTHHYPFRLVNPEILTPYLEQVSQREGIIPEPGVLGLIIRAGQGSVRDSLSVLDQLMAGSTGNTIEYKVASSLLGYTDTSLLAEMVDALGAKDGAAVFEVVEKTVEAGVDPRQFTQDLLQRFRDVLICGLIPDQAGEVLPQIPAAELETMKAQAASWGTRALSRRADQLDEALRTMSGTASHRLQLELLLGRILTEDGDTAAKVPPRETKSPRAPQPAKRPALPPAEASPTSQPEPAAPPADTKPAQPPAPPRAKPRPSMPEPAPEAPAETVPAAAPQPKPAVHVPAGGLSQEELRAKWDELVAAVDQRGRAAGARLAQTKPIALEGGTFYLAPTGSGAHRLSPGEQTREVIDTVAAEVFGLTVEIGPGPQIANAEETSPVTEPPGADAPRGPEPRQAPADPPADPGSAKGPSEALRGAPARQNPSQVAPPRPDVKTTPAPAELPPLSEDDNEISLEDEIVDAGPTGGVEAVLAILGGTVLDPEEEETP